MRRKDTSVIVEMSGERFHLLVKHFKDQERNDWQVRNGIAQHEKWYGIIDGRYYSTAVKKHAKA